MKIGIRVMPKSEVLDSQGRAIEKTLVHHGKTLKSCRVGKFIELDFGAASREEAEKRAREIAEFILYNPLIETYQIEASNP